MDNFYLLMIVALAILAIADLVVGVSNDAVNFLNSAIGSKAVSFKTIMIVASIGIACGAIFSSGMMEVARKGIFNPSMFMFSDIMIIFMAVMITDILLLDFFKIKNLYLRLNSNLSRLAVFFLGLINYFFLYLHYHLKYFFYSQNNQIHILNYLRDNYFFHFLPLILSINL